MVYVTIVRVHTLENFLFKLNASWLTFFFFKTITSSAYGSKLEESSEALKLEILEILTNTQQWSTP